MTKSALAPISAQSAPQSTHRVAMTTSGVHSLIMVKSAHLPFPLSTITSNVVVYAPAERADTFLLFLLYPNMYSLFWLPFLALPLNPLSGSLLCLSFLASPLARPFDSYPPAYPHCTYSVHCTQCTARTPANLVIIDMGLPSRYHVSVVRLYPFPSLSPQGGRHIDLFDCCGDFWRRELRGKTPIRNSLLVMSTF